MQVCVILFELTRVDIVGLALTGVIELWTVFVTIGVAVLTS